MSVLADLYVQRKRERGWRMPEGAVNCTRPGRWGNPFKVGEIIVLLRDDGTWWLEVEVDPELAVSLYRSYIYQRGFAEQYAQELSGRVLACWCAGSPCHVIDVLLSLANPELT